MLFSWEKGKENFYVGPKHFPFGPTQNLSLQNGEKTGWEEFDGEMTKLLMCNAHGQIEFLFFLSLFTWWFLGNIASFIYYYYFFFFFWLPGCSAFSFFLFFFFFYFLGMVLCVFFFLKLELIFFPWKWFFF